MVNWIIILNIAKIHLLTKIKQTAVAALGVTFGIAAYITLVSFMTGLNSMLDDLILNQTPHIHVYNEIEPSKKQPISLYETYKNSFNIVHSIKPKLSQKKIHNALPIINYLNNDKNVEGAIPQIKASIFYIAGSIELGGNITGINPLEESRLFNFKDYVIKGSPEDLKNTENGTLIGSGVAKKMSLSVGDRVQISTIKGNIFPLKIVGIYQSGIADLDATKLTGTIASGRLGNVDLTDKNLLNQAEAKTILISDIKPIHSELLNLNCNPRELNKALNELHKLEIQSVLVEGGSQVLQSFINSDLWDEVRLFENSEIIKKGIKAPSFNKLLANQHTVGNCMLKQYFNTTHLDL